jgi:hypothetical protein
MIWLRWLLFSALLLVGGCVVLCNWGIAVEAAGPPDGRRADHGHLLVAPDL